MLRMSQQLYLNIVLFCIKTFCHRYIRYEIVAFKHPSEVNDFYFTPTRDSSTQFTDFNDRYNTDSDDYDYSWDSRF